MRISKVFFYVMAAVALAACSNDDNDIIDNGQEQPLPLTITVNETPLHNPNAPAQVPATRTAVTTTSTLTAFTLDYQYYIENELMSGKNSATKDGSGNWSAGTWPTGADESTTVNWFAHTDGEIPSWANYLSFTVDEQSDHQKDLLVATASGTKNDTGGNLSFTFDHACTALQFYVKKATNLKDYTLTVTDIKICNIVSDGKYYFSTSAWTPGTFRSKYSLYTGSGMILGTENYILLNPNENDFLFMIPQTLTPWDTTTDIASATGQTYIRLVCSITGATSFNGTAYIPFAATLAAGMQHDVKINIGKNSLYSGPNTKIIN
jgi:hypothetical protein